MATATHLGDMTVEEAAKEAAGNWRTFECFVWWREDGGMINSDTAVMPGEWSHVAGVFAESETKLYLNGKLIVTGPGSANREIANFVIGCAGEANPIGYFRGQIRSVRISEGEWYDEDFEPPSDFTRDGSTLLLIAEPRLEGETVVGVDGEVVGRVESLTTKDH